LTLGLSLLVLLLLFVGLSLLLLVRAAVSVADPVDPWLVAARAVVVAVLVSEALPIVPVSVVSLVGPDVRKTERPMPEAKTEQS
jgi:hypothetical protein